MTWETVEASTVEAVDIPEGMAAIVVDGRVAYEPKDAPFHDAVLRHAREAGLGKFRVYAGGVEIDDPEDAPATIGEAEQPVRITRYDLAG